LRAQLEYSAVQTRTAGSGGSVDIAHLIQDNPFGKGWVLAGIASREVVQDLLGPASARSRSQLKYISAPAASVGRRAENISVIENQSFRISGVDAAAKTMQYRLRPGSVGCRRELEHRALTVGATAVGRAVKIAGAIEGQAEVRIDAIAAVVDEVIQNFLVPPAAARGR